MADTRFILAGRLIDGTGTAVQRNIFLAVSNGLITAMGPSSQLPETDKDSITDLSHCTLLPALMDCSCSLLNSPSVDEATRNSNTSAHPDQQEVLLKRQISYCYAHGVLGVATADSLSKFKRDGQGEAITIKHATDPYTTPGDNGDFIKVAYSATIEDETSPTPPKDPEKLLQALQQANNRKIVVIANGAQQVSEAIAAGCHAIEQGYSMGPANLKEMAKKNILWIPSVLRAKNGLDGASAGGDVCCRFSQRYVAPGKPMPGAEAYWQEVLNRQLSQLRQARELGVHTAVGTGAGSVGILHGESMVEEIKLFIKAGYCLEEAIRCGSQTGAQFFNIKEFGPLTPGNRATFLVTRGTPQQLPRKLSYLEGIYINGRPSGAYQKIPNQS